MRITLVTPPYNLLKEGYGTKMYSKYASYPPLGIGYIAAALEKTSHKVKIVDSQAALLNNEQILSEIYKFGSDAVGISAVTACANSACELAIFLKKKLNIPVIMGGPHPTCFPEAVYKKAKDIDLLVVGEGEETIKEIISVIDCKDRWKNIDGICFLDGDHNFIMTNRREPIDDLDKIEPPARHLYNNEFYHPIPNLHLQLPATNMITSRGCPYAKCAFCYQAGRMKQRYRRHSPERIIGEIGNLVKQYGIKEVAFWDDNFIVSKDWIKKFCGLLIEKRLNLSWSCYSRVDMVSKEALDMVGRAGCWSIFYGLESGAQELLDIINKGITLEQSRSAVKWAHQAGIETRGSFMLALPGENPQLAKKTIDFAIQLNLDSAQFLATYPEYGTKLYDKAVGTGQFMDYKGRHAVTYVPEGYKSAGEVKKVIKNAYLRFYLRPSFFLKYIRRIKSWKDFLKYLEGFRMVLGIATHN
ncbi:MAG: cobalamin-dependent protein [Candidatus Omnitrophica bacterium]|nr:cobalamin-dependent protein [Candidatus Omnitrophota bacterium]